MTNSRLTKKLQGSNGFVFSVYAILAAFATYSCMYAFRKPFTVATFEGLAFYGVEYKVLLVTAQILGYTLSKFIGIRLVSGMKVKKRAASIFGLIVFAGVSLFFFGLVSAPYNIIFLFLNGLPLGIIWGLVFSYLEGRTTTEVLGAGLSASFIISSGFVKTIGKTLIVNWGVSEFWMPFLTGAIFIIPLLFFLWMLDQLPPPNAKDVSMRTRRKSMNGADRMAFFNTFMWGIILMVVIYWLLTIFREFRDNFAAEIWIETGYGDKAHVFTSAEIPVAFGVLVIMSLAMLIKNNFTALFFIKGLILVGFILIGFSTFAFRQNIIGPMAWMILVGSGLYLGYVPFNAFLFDRLIAAFRYASNVGFVMYIADSFGYLGSIGVYFYKNFMHPDVEWVQFFIRTGYVVAFSGAGFTILALIYFIYKKRNYKFTE